MAERVEAELTHIKEKREAGAAAVGPDREKDVSRRCLRGTRAGLR